MYSRILSSSPTCHCCPLVTVPLKAKRLRNPNYRGHSFDLQMNLQIFYVFDHLGVSELSKNTINRQIGMQISRIDLFGESARDALSCIAAASGWCCSSHPAICFAKWPVGRRLLKLTASMGGCCCEEVQTGQMLLACFMFHNLSLPVELSAPTGDSAISTTLYLLGGALNHWKFKQN